MEELTPPGLRSPATMDDVFSIKWVSQLPQRSVDPPYLGAGKAQAAKWQQSRGRFRSSQGSVELLGARGT